MVLAAQGARAQGPAPPASDPGAPLAVLADAGTSQAAHRIVATAMANSAYREEAARLLQELGEVAVPALIEAKGRANPLETRKWAIAVLESMNKKVPGEAVQTKDAALLAEVLRAYGKTRDLDALGAIFAFANSDRTPVREAAREAIVQYGDSALSKLRETYTNLKNGPPPEGWGAPELARELFRLMDHARLRDLYALFDEALAKAKGDTPEAAVAALDQVFARAPSFERRGEAVPIYLRYAESLEATDPARALDYYRRAERLSPEGTERNRVTSAIATIEARGLAERGVLDREALRRALELHPDNEKAKAALERLDAEEQSRTHRLRMGIGIGAAIVALLAAILLFLHRKAERPLPAAENSGAGKGV
ncbi:hypothetical protein [Pendulispora albinea]|uniref:Uncharacterized protein n=1 Tax=Pendulispora albinea TaxID=2741071 RepID=A0ABZ2LTW6_9BACT